MRVIGTAGHVDHGKSTLVEAITGIHPDRLKEEREREMTIDLGFAWFTLPDGEEVGVVDVPGHRDFIENMLAGVGGIDAALFVVAADEGVMPQTREHLAILDLLQIKSGVVALTKVDLISDREWIDLIEDELRQVFTGTVLDGAAIVRVSARTGEGLKDLISAIGECLAKRPVRLDYHRPRLPVDRVFSVPGFGTVVTGTLSDGAFHLGEEVEILPAGLRSRIRGLQTHKRKEDTAAPGSRTAVNLSGVDLDQVKRGDVIAHARDYQPTRRLDAHVRLLPDASQAIKHNIDVKFFLGAAEIIARLRLLGAEEIVPGDEGWLQIELSEPVVAARGDRYILRRPSPGETIGGGMVVDPHPKGRHRRFAQEVIDRLKTLEEGDPTDVLFQAMLALGAASVREVVARSKLDAENASRALDILGSSGKCIFLEEKENTQPGLNSDSLVVTLDYWTGLSQRLSQELSGYHQAFPLKRGMPREELKSRMKLTSRLFNAALRRWLAQGDLHETVRHDSSPVVHKSSHQVKFSAAQQSQVEGLLARFNESLFTPPSVKECQLEVGDDVYQALVELGQLVQVSPEVVYSREGYDRMVGEVRRLLAQRGSVTAGEVRDHLNTSRKYILALLEHLDSIGVTVRQGDARRLK